MFSSITPFVSQPQIRLSQLRRRNLSSLLLSRTFLFNDIHHSSYYFLGRSEWIFPRLYLSEYLLFLNRMWSWIPVIEEPLHEYLWQYVWLLIIITTMYYIVATAIAGYYNILNKLVWTPVRFCAGLHRQCCMYERCALLDFLSWTGYKL